MSFEEFDEYDRQDELREWDYQPTVPEEQYSPINQSDIEFEGGADQPPPAPKLEPINYEFLNGLRGIGSFSVYLCHFHN